MTSSPTQLEAEPAGRAHGSASAARALTVALLSVAFVVAAYLVFVGTADGQRLDAIAIAHVGQSGTTKDTLSMILRGGTIGLVVLTAATCAVLALSRRRWRLGAAAAALVVGATVTTEALKHVVLTRPDHGYDATNTFPSGHTTVTCSLVFAALLVVPHAGRWLVQLVGSLGLGVVGTGTVVAGWHRPSDVIGGFGVTLAWGAVILALVSISGTTPSTRPPRAHPLAILTGLVVTAGFFLALGIRPERSVTDLAVLAVTMTGLAVAGALTIGIFCRLVDARVT